MAEGVANDLPIGADKPSLQSERRARTKRSARTTTQSPEKQKRRRIAEPSSNSVDTVNDTQTPTATAMTTATAMATAGSKPEARTETEMDLHENEDAGERVPEVSTNDETPPRRSTKAVMKLGL